MMGELDRERFLEPLKLDELVLQCEATILYPHTSNKRWYFGACVLIPTNRKESLEENSNGLSKEN